MTSDAYGRHVVASIRDEILRRGRFLISSHARPDGDSIGSQLAMAFALGELGKECRIVNRDEPPEHYYEFPGVDSIAIATRVDPAWGDFDAEIIMECGDLPRTGVEGLGRAFVINIDHHLGNTMYGSLNWFDESASACGEMVFELIRALGVRLTPEIATHVYLAILTDTGSFHHSNITPRTFEVCRQVTEAGVNPASMARRVFDSNSYGKLKLIGHLLDSMELHGDGRLAVMCMTQDLLDHADSTVNDTEGIINLPLTAREIQAVVFFKALEAGQVRVSMRSKYDVDVRAVAVQYGGGGHTNAAGFSVPGGVAEVRPAIIQKLVAEVERAAQQRETELSRK
ncbi:MAG TPA: bifunctional oligoribonuclease/PAP phosphatase NrnA [Vicinamibacterales bacterium]|nr:bifunctional oligoribonuclease/PAP phosphatase NrnA [Vicinamibacterales bacterium]